MKKVVQFPFNFAKRNDAVILSHTVHTHWLWDANAHTLHSCHTPHNAQLLLQEIQQHTANCIPWRRSPGGCPPTRGAAVVVGDMYCCLLPAPGTPAHRQETVKVNPLWWCNNLNSKMQHLNLNFGWFCIEIRINTNPGKCNCQNPEHNTRSRPA